MKIKMTPLYSSDERIDIRFSIIKNICLSMLKACPGGLTMMSAYLGNSPSSSRIISVSLSFLMIKFLS